MEREEIRNKQQLLYEAVKAYLSSECEVEEVIRIHNEYVEYGDNHIYELNKWEINELFPDAWSFIERCRFGKFNDNDDYFWYDGCGNIQSGSSYDTVEENVDYVDLADYIVRNEEIFGNDELEYIVLDNDVETIARVLSEEEEWVTAKLDEFDNESE